MPQVGDKVLLATGTTTPDSAGKSGTNKMWNFASLNYKSEDTLAFAAPSATPYYSNFQRATVADSEYGTIGYSYYLDTVTQFSVIGTVQNYEGYTVPVATNPFFTQLMFPANYLESDCDTSMGKTQTIAIHVSGFDSGRGKLVVIYADTIDAWGTLITPFGTYQVLRQKHYESDIDSLWGYEPFFNDWAFAYSSVINANEFRWYTNTLNFMPAIMQMSSDFDTVKSFQWYNGTPAAGIENITNPDIAKAFPDPCNSQITFRISSAAEASLFVYDVSGRQAGSIKIARGTAILNTNSLAQGLYFYDIVGDNKKIETHGKFCVEK